MRGVSATVCNPASLVDCATTASRQQLQRRNGKNLLKAAPDTPWLDAETRQRRQRVCFVHAEQPMSLCLAVVL